MKRLWKAGGLLLSIQMLLLAAYFGLKDAKVAESGGSGAPRTAAPSMVGGALPEIQIQDRKGERRVLALGLEPTLIHFWATWCLPCRDELPGLLALDSEGVKVIAIAVDPSWESMEQFFNGEVPTQVVLSDAGRVRSALGVRTLPVTFLVNEGKSLQLRFDGARDWTSESFRRLWLGAPAAQ